jgi:hemoglobin
VSAISPIPESQERRAALAAEITARTGLDEATLERVLRAFYAEARQDDLLGPVFARVGDWEAHIDRIVAFWSSVALMTGRYQGNPMGAHLPLGLEPAHFARWLALFERTVRAGCAPEGAELLIGKARRIAQSLQLGIEVQRGVLPRPAARRTSAVGTAAG